MTVDKIYDVLKSKYDVMDYDDFIILIDCLRNSIKYFNEFSFADENIWTKLTFPETPGHSEFQKFLIMVYIAGNQFTKDNIKRINDVNKNSKSETEGIILSFIFVSNPKDKRIIQNITIPLSMLYLSKDKSQDGIFAGILQILFTELEKQRTEIEIQKAKEKELKEENKGLKKENIALKEVNELTGELQLWPMYKADSLPAIRRDIFKIFFDYQIIEKHRTEHPEHLQQTLYGTMTVNKQLDKMKAWLDSFDFKGLEYLVKLFAFINSVKTYRDKYPQYKDIDFYEDAKRPGFIVLRAVTNETFWAAFLKKRVIGEKKKEYYITSDKNKLLDWLVSMTKPIDILQWVDDRFELIPNGLKLISLKIDDNPIDGKKNIHIGININILDNDFIDYISLDPGLFEAIESQIEKIETWKDFIKFNQYIAIKNYYDCIVRFYLILKTSYNRCRDTITDNGFLWNKFELKEKELFLRLGNLRGKIRNDLIKRKNIRASNKTTDLENNCCDFILGMIFDTASELKWLNATPRNPIKGKYEFNLNRAHFDPQKTANEIKLIKNGVDKTTDKVDKTTDKVDKTTDIF